VNVFLTEGRKILLKKKPIALALGGGGARGFAHIGVLRVLEKAEIPIAVITGTSMGAIVGAVYAQLLSAEAVEKKFRDLLKSPEFKASGMHYAGKKKLQESWFDQLANQIRERIVVNVASHRKAAINIERLYSALDFLLKDDLIERTKVPFGAVASDLIDGEEVIITKGSIREAVAASAALPGFLPPIDLNSRLLVDGAVTSPVPIRAARALVDEDTKVVAVDVSQELPKEPKLDNIIDLVLRSYHITAKCYHEELIKEADVLVQPRVKDFHWSEFDKIEWLINEGQFAAEEKLEEIEDATKAGIFNLM